MRKKLSVLNAAFGGVYRIVVILLGFIVRYFFVKELTYELLGYEGLFSNILGILSLVEMGMGTAISFSLYEPIHKKNIPLISALVKLYKKVYIILGCSIFILSMLLTPFLGYIINDNQVPIEYIQKAFIIYSLGVAITYFCSYKRTIIFALQRNYIVLIVDIVCKIVTNVTQIILLIKCQNYLLYLIVQLAGNFIPNLIISYICDRKDVYDKKTKYVLDKGYKRELLIKVKDLAVTNFASKAVYSTDNILISIILGAKDLSKNANYSMIILAVQSVISSILGGASASIGDLLVENESEKKKRIFNQYSYLYFLVAGFCTVSFYFLVDPFISIWVGKKYLFSDITNFILSINMYLYLIQQPVWTFQNMGGLYSKYKYVSVIQVFINLAASIIFGNLFGVVGIFIGTTLCNIYGWICFIGILSENLIEMNKKTYWLRQLRYVLYVASIGVALKLINIYCISNMGSDISKLIVNLFAIVMIYFVVYFLILRKEENADIINSLIKCRSSRNRR